MDSDNQIYQVEPQTGKRGTLRAYVLIMSVEIALIALLRAVHVPWGILSALLVFALLAALIGEKLIGSAKHVQIISLTFEQRIDHRYRIELNQLSNLGFKSSFYYGEAFPLSRLLLIYPAFLFLIMLLNREVASIQNGSELWFGFPVFISNNRTAYAHPMQLGMKYHTVFQDGTILMSKNFGGKTNYGPTVFVHIMKNASIGDTWVEHEKRIQALEATGKQIDRKISFDAFSNIQSLG